VTQRPYMVVTGSADGSDVVVKGKSAIKDYA